MTPNTISPKNEICRILLLRYAMESAVFLLREERAITLNLFRRSSMEQNNYEIVKFVDNGFELEVNVSPSEETVWLTVNQLALLFDVQVPAIVKHISNIISSEELDLSTISILEKVQNEGGRNKRRRSKIYNLDMIIAVGYRVNSKRGTIFRQWANKVLKQYLLKGYAIDSSRVLVTQENYMDLVNVVNRIDSTQSELIIRVEKLETKYPELNTFVYACGQMYDATSFMGQIMEKARKEIILIDNYVDKGTLDILSHKNRNASIRIITSKEGNRITEKEIQTFRAQYGNLTIEITDKVHDRFLVLDGTEMYHIGASLKDAGKKLFQMDLVRDPAIISFILENAI